jgi:hypothetical protein
MDSVHSIANVDNFFKTFHLDNQCLKKNINLSIKTMAGLGFYYGKTNSNNHQFQFLVAALQHIIIYPFPCWFICQATCFC